MEFKEILVLIAVGFRAVLILFGSVDLFRGFVYDNAYRASRGDDWVTVGLVVYMVELVMYAYLRHKGRFG